MDTKQAVGGTGTLISLSATIYFQLHPTWATENPLLVKCLYGLTVCFLAFTLLQFKFVQRLLNLRPIEKPDLSSQAPSAKSEMNPSNSFNPTASATGGSVTVITNKVDPDEIAEAVAKRLDESSPALSPGDGFVQLETENMELQIPEPPPLKVGQTFSLKYHYSNRGGLPVYCVQTWGILHFLVIELNPPDRLKSLMLSAAQDGHTKFPNGGSTLSVGTNHWSFAALGTPLTEEQIEGVKQGIYGLFFVVGGVWKDNRDRLHFWSDGRMAELPHFPNLDVFHWRGI